MRPQKKRLVTTGLANPRHSKHIQDLDSHYSPIRRTIHPGNPQLSCMNASLYKHSIVRMVLNAGTRQTAHTPDQPCLGIEGNSGGPWKQKSLPSYHPLPTPGAPPHPHQLRPDPEPQNEHQLHRHVDRPSLSQAPRTDRSL